MSTVTLSTTEETIIITANDAHQFTSSEVIDLTDAGDSSLHYHSSDRARATHTGTQEASTISDFDTEVANNTAVTLNSAKETNITTDLTEGTATGTTVDVNSSDGINATLVSASTSRAGLLTNVKFDEVVANSAARHTHTNKTLLDTLTEDNLILIG